jgi:hypothetical protein
MNGFQGKVSEGMRATLSCVLVVLLLVLPIATTITPSFCPTWNPMQTACPLAPDVLERLTFALEHEVKTNSEQNPVEQGLKMRGIHLYHGEQSERHLLLHAWQICRKSLHA